MQLLIIDDSQAMLLLVKGVISKLGDYEIQTYLEASEAIAWCQDHTPDLVVVDYLMPGLNGLDFVRQFRALAGKDKIPVLMLTADHSLQITTEATAAGVTDFLNKPFDRLTIQSRLMDLLSRIEQAETQRALADFKPERFQKTQ